MKQIKYCKNCVLPNTRPNLILNGQGVCNAAGCSKENQKAKIDWEDRARCFSNLVKDIKKLNRDFDCIIPVSGGKDSTWQTLKALEYDLRPLCVTWKSGARNELGRKNLENLIDLGVAHLDVTINPKVEKLFSWKAFERFGSPVIPMHMALHAIPMQMAIKFNIPLILWGENSAYEYGGPSDLTGVELTHKWLQRFGVTNGTTSDDWLDDELTTKDMTFYSWPSEKILKAHDLKAVFLGHFFKWDPLQTFQIAKDHGFVASDTPITGIYEFADVDDAFLITIHHWMKWYKFGFTRAFDNLSLEIRNNRKSRTQAIEILTELGNHIPKSQIQDFCRYVGRSESEFYSVAETHRNLDVWERDKNGVWKIPGFLIESWNW